jgi:torulene dioxygenase
VDLTVKGTIPLYVAGSLYRMGPGQFTIENTPRGTYRTTHWFDGFAHAHKFEIIPNSQDPQQPMRVQYTSRRQSEQLVEAIKAKGSREHSISFGQRRDPCIGVFGKVMTAWHNASPASGAGAANICVTVQANVPALTPKHDENSKGCQTPATSGHRSGFKNVWAATDNSTMKKFDLETLEPIGWATQGGLHPALTGALSCAHAHRDPDSGDFFNYNLELGRISTYRIFRVNAATGTTDILASVTSKMASPAYIHSFFLSPSFVILCVPSSHLGMMGLKVLWERNILDAIDPFDESKLCKWFVVDRRGGRGIVATFETAAACFFHSVNAFEERDEATGAIDLYCDVVQYASSDILRSFELDVILQRDDKARQFWGDETRNRNTQSNLVRHKFRIPSLDCGKPGKDKEPLLPPEALLGIRNPHIGELPTINPAYATRRYRYVYSLPNRGRSTMHDSIAKTDLETREVLFWENPHGHSPGEAIFVARPLKEGEAEAAEDDGALLSVVLDGVRGTSYLLCLDARTMKELGRAECDWAIGLGFHGVHSSTAAAWT